MSPCTTYSQTSFTIDKAFTKDTYMHEGIHCLMFKGTATKQPFIRNLTL